MGPVQAYFIVRLFSLDKLEQVSCGAVESPILRLFA